GPASLHEGKAAFSLAAGAAQKHVAGFRIDVEVSFAGFLDRDEDAFAGAFVTGVGEAGNAVKPGAQSGQDELPGRGDVVGAAGHDPGDPQRDPGRAREALDEAGVLVRLPGVPLVYLCTLATGFLVGAAVGRDERAVQDGEGKSLLSGLFE